jgi:5-(aminomethyl)-3-furanmethanol phosphate kinase
VIVVKVGGSLFDAPALGPALRAYLGTLAPQPVLLVAGGGPVADAVRELDRTHALGEAAAHWLALASLDVTAGLLERFVGERARVLNCLTFAREDDARPGALPHAWAVTTDSIAARAAEVFAASRLVLLKSVDVPVGISHEEAARRGFVDAHFPTVAARLTCAIEYRNFRHELAAHA